MKKINYLFALVLLFTFACGGAATTEEAATEEAVVVEEVVVEEVMAKDIVTLAVETEALSTLVAALKAGELV
ncbi:MAG: putative surface protein with fasciclin (FAS1) repeats, partial [Marivirga sp.]